MIYPFDAFDYFYRPEISMTTFDLDMKEARIRGD